MEEIIVFAKSSVVSIITLLYITLAYNKAGKPSDVPYKLIMFSVPIVYGIFGLIDYKLKKHSILIGIVLGLFFSIIGRFVLGLPKKIFNYNSINEYQVHIIAVVMYVIIFRFIINKY